MALDSNVLIIGIIVGVGTLGIGAVLYFTLKKKKPEEPNAAQAAAGTQPANKSILETKKSDEEPLFAIDTNQPPPTIPEVKDLRTLDIRYPLIPPYTFAHLKWDGPNNEVVYTIEEPELTLAETDILKTLEDGIRELINLSFISVKDQRTIIIYLEKNIKILLTELAVDLSMESYMKIMYYIYRDFVGLNDLEPLMNDYYIEDIECNGLNTPVYVVHRKFRNIRTSLVYKDLHVMAGFVEKLAQKCGKYVSYAEPLLDGSLPDGSIEYNEPVIYRENGIVKVGKIGEVVDTYYKNQESNTPIAVKGIEVAAFNQGNLKISWKKAQYVYRHKIDEELYGLDLEFGRKISLTGCHSVFTLRSDGIKSERTDTLKEGDYVVLAGKIPESDTIKEINLAAALAVCSQKDKLVLRGVPHAIFETKKKELYVYYRKHYIHANQAHYEHKNKRILPLELYYLLSEGELRKCFMGTTSSHKIPTFLAVTKELMWFLGLYLAEGWLYDYASYGVSFSLNKLELNLIEEIKRSAKKCFNVEARVEKEKDNGVKVHVCDALVWLVMKEVLCVTEGAKRKRVPELIFNVAKELQQEFVDAWHAGDYSTTMSKDLANEIAYVALFNEDIAAFYKGKPKTTFIKGREIRNEGAYYSNFYARDVENPYPAMIPVEMFNPLNKTHGRLRNKRVSRGRMRDITNEIRYQRFENLHLAPEKFILEWEKRGMIKDKYLTEEGKKLLEEINIVKKLLDSDFCFAKIKKISRVKAAGNFVYDFSVAGDENFVAGTGGICCHNSRVNSTYSIDVTSRGPTFCFVDGYFQLGDGKVVKIDELFNEAKQRFETKNENGNEVVYIKNMTCCGVDAKTLAQTDAKLKTVIKLQPPEKLVELDLEDGAKMKVTTNHLFHVAGEQLALVEAEHLKEGMLIPVPVKVNVEGCLQTINTIAVLKEFSYAHKICIMTNTEIKKVVAQTMEGKTRKSLAEEYGMSAAYFYEVISRGNAISFEVLDRICSEQHTAMQSLGEMQVVVYGGGTKGKSKAMKIPQVVDEDLAYLAGAVMSDGHLNENSIDIACHNDGFASTVAGACQKNFKQSEAYYDGARLYVCNKFAPFFFNRIFGIPYGKKSDKIRVPEIIFKSSNKVVAAFVRGLFDGDGTCKSGLSYKTNSRRLAEEMTYLLARLGIYAYLREKKEQNQVVIPSLYEEEFAEKIGFTDSRKKEDLKMLLEKKCSDRSYNRHGRIPALPILQLMKKAGISKNQVAKKTGASYNRLLYQDTLSGEYVKKILDLIPEKKEWKQEVEYARWLVNAQQEFVKIRSVKIIENTEKLPVYDIELEPCTFFIAGNKPMNVFDTIRKFIKEPWSPVTLIQKGSVTAEILAYLWMLIEYENSFMVIGGTGTGKTSFLNAIAFFMPPQARIVTIEDSVTGDAEIIVKKKDEIIRTTMQELHKRKDKKEVEVLTMDKQLKIKFTRPGAFIRHRTVKDIYRVTTATGRVVNVTKDHSLFTLTHEGISEIKPESLEANESHIAVPRVLPIEGKGIDCINLLDHTEIFKKEFLVGDPVRKIFSAYKRKDFKISKSMYQWWKEHNIIRIKYLQKIKYAFTADEMKMLFIKSRTTTKIPVVFPLDDDILKLIGLWLGDGSYDNYNANRVIISDNEKEAIAVYKKISKKLGINVSLMKDDWSWAFNSTVFYKLMKYVLRLDGDAKTKKIPGFVFNLTNEQVRHVIAGYFGADGTVKTNEISCASQSENLLSGVQTLLLRFGIIGRIPRYAREDGCRELNISAYENINKFKGINFVHEEKNKKLAVLGNIQPTHTSSDVIPINPLWIPNLAAFRKQFRNYHNLNNSFPGREFMNNFISEETENIPASTLAFLGDIADSDILWDKVVKIEKMKKRQRYVYDISVPETEKFIAQNIVLHNTRELKLEHENWLPSVARAGVGLATAAGTKYGEVSLFDLLKASFRQRPDYIIVGEIRGTEAYVLFQAMASGHPSTATMHAESVETMVRRLQTPPINLSGSLVMTLSAVVVMQQTRIKGKEVRKVASVDEVVDVKELNAGGQTVANNVFKWNPANDTFSFNPNSNVFKTIVEHYGLTKEQVLGEFNARAHLLREMYRKGVTNYKEVQVIIQQYYKNPDAVLKKFGIAK